MAKTKITDDVIISASYAYRREADMAMQERTQTNRQNWDCYHMRQDFDYKQKGQSREFLPKMSMAVEQAANFLQQGLADIGDWFSVDAEPGIPEEMMLIKPGDIRKLLDRHLAKTKFLPKVGDMAKYGLIASQIIVKVNGKMVPKPRFDVESKLKDGKYSQKLIKKEDKKWQLDLQLISPTNFRIDPSGQGLYEFEDMYIDYYKLLQMAEEDKSPYDLKVIKELAGSFVDTGTNHQYDRAREQGLNTTSGQSRRTVKVTEYWGNLVSPDGELLYENCVWAIANDSWVIRQPDDNPLWHGESPYVAASILTVPNSPIGRALMDAPTMLNRAQNEMFNLTIDGGMMAVHGIKQIRKSWLDDESQVEDGISSGTTLAVNNACPPGATVLERVDTSTIPQDGLAVLNLLNQEFNVSAMTNDLRMGVASFRSVKATEVVEASQTISSMFSGMAKNIEMLVITPILEKAWKTMLQHMDDFDTKELEALLGSAKAAQLQRMGKEQLFAQCVQGAVFKVYGISAILNQRKEAQSYMAMLQTVSMSPVLGEAFAAKYDFTKLLSELMKAWDIKPDKIESDHAKAAAQQASQPPQPQANQPGQPGAQPVTPNIQSQIPQAMGANQAADGSAAQAAQPVQHALFPKSKATPAGSGTAV